MQDETSTDQVAQAQDGPLLFGRILDGQGGGRAISWPEALAWEPGTSGEVLWVHLDRTTEGLAEMLQGQLSMPEPTLRLLTGDGARPRAFREGDTLVASLRGINFNPGAHPEDMITMQLWSDGKRLLTLRRRPMQTPRDTLADIDAGKGPRDAGALITSLTDYMVSRMDASIVDMNVLIDECEKANAEDEPGTLLENIVMIRRNCLALQRHMGPQHGALERISREAPAWFEDHDRREIAETIERLRRYLDDIDISKESAVVLLDELRTRAAARSDRTNYLLTIVAAIFLPLGFVTGLMGINVGGMPGLENADAFWIVVGLCVTMLMVQLVLFWRWKWL